MITKPNTINIIAVKKRWYHYIFEKFIKTHDAVNLCKVSFEVTICCSKSGKVFIKPKSENLDLAVSACKGFCQNGLEFSANSVGIQ